ncbi:MAG: hypothetical protein A2271_03355 [Candidatus Moranbacteria bacterium RIFOXYA12_FULL_35_19]|nr:MAG: hypothetical protein A2343_03075 [Candidatus Moranbacteria bacterium RIFOXYB12_FULL_35_8]OGI33413.1 MAG: hypothetical protein A2489_03480 [Candidatus Moranbacteria bacterium RIFOXYC12_FULL_36_13]OGI36349.1 MAG: hypothetical protein A2271_03355 [Candidatus Moranbacteria bacterium RIFOXYA12_FULL_35_19]
MYMPLSIFLTFYFRYFPSAILWHFAFGFKELIFYFCFYFIKNIFVFVLGLQGQKSWSGSDALVRNTWTAERFSIANRGKLRLKTIPPSRISC